MRHACGAYATLRAPVDFGAADERPVDLVFMLLLPEDLPGEQLRPLACVARRLRDPDVQRALRAARDPAVTPAILTSG